MQILPAISWLVPCCLMLHQTLAHRREFDQLKAIKIHGHTAIFPNSSEVVPLICWRGPSHHRIPLFNKLFNVCPNSFADWSAPLRLDSSVCVL